MVLISGLRKSLKTPEKRAKKNPTTVGPTVSSLNPPYISKCSSSFTLCLSASLSLVSIFSFASVLHFYFSVDSISSWFSPISVHIFPTTLSHLIPARPFVTFSYTTLSAPLPPPLFSHPPPLRSSVVSCPLSLAPFPHR